jgi:thiamine pyrophosphokinase
MIGIVYTGGKGPQKKYVESLLAESNYIIAADSGFNLAIKHGVTPDKIVGDFDSIGRMRRLKKIEKKDKSSVIKFPCDKDETDTEIGIRLLFEMGYTKIILIGGGGGRPDHYLALFSLFDRDESPVRWLNHRSDIHLITNKITIKVQIGETLSFFPAGDGQCIMESQGLKWPLNSLKWKKGDFGVSNIAIEPDIYVKMLSGKLIMIRNLG